MPKTDNANKERGRLAEVFSMFSGQKPKEMIGVQPNPTALIDIAKKLHESYEGLLSTSRGASENDILRTFFKIKQYETAFLKGYQEKYGKENLDCFKQDFVRNLIDMIDMDNERKEKRMSRKLFILTPV
jgi:hypothetical protein